MTCGWSVRIVVTMMSAQTTRPPNAEASLPPFFQSAACVRRITCAGLPYTHTRSGSNVARSSGETSRPSNRPGSKRSTAASERWPACLVSVYMPSHNVPELNMCDRLFEAQRRDSERADAVFAREGDHPPVSPRHVDDLAIHAQLLEIPGRPAGAIGNGFAWT